MRRYLRRRDAVLREVPGHCVVLPGRGALPPGVCAFLLDGPVARFLWDALGEPRTLDELADLVSDSFAVERARARDDARAFLDQLAAADLLANRA